MKILLSIVVLLSVCASVAIALENGLARTPQMGWNRYKISLFNLSYKLESWNHFACDVSETLIKQTADTIVKTGLKDAGYIYVNIDDCWQISRTAAGEIVPDPQRFPSGMKALADYIHSLGLKFGVYSDAGNYTCQHRPGSLGFETQDANSYASWGLLIREYGIGVDYLKYDNCFRDGIPPIKRYPVMRDALNATGRPILYSMCEWGQDDPATWAVSVGNSWRTTNDISDRWTSMLDNLDYNDKWAQYAQPGAWNDPDMLEVGNDGMTTSEYRLHFSLWCLVKAPLIIGCDVTNMSNDTYTIITNSELIAVNQDPLGVQGKKMSQDGALEIWGGPLSGNRFVAALVNRGLHSASVTLEYSAFGISGERQLRNLWTHTDLGSFTNTYSATVASHDVVMILIQAH